jgi:hypothetical protein
MESSSMMKGHSGDPEQAKSMKTRPQRRLNLLIPSVPGCPWVVHPRRFLNTLLVSDARNVIPLKRTHLFNVVHQGFDGYRGEGEAETMSCIPPLHFHPHDPMCVYTHVGGARLSSGTKTDSWAVLWRVWLTIDISERVLMDAMVPIGSDKALLLRVVKVGRVGKQSTTE